MKKKLSAVTITLIVTVIATCILGWDYKVFASDTGNATELTNTNIEYNQFEMPVIAINTISDDKISSDEVYSNAQISIINDEGNYEMTDIDMSIKLRGNKFYVCK